MIDDDLLDEEARRRPTRKQAERMVLAQLTLELAVIGRMLHTPRLIRTVREWFTPVDCVEPLHEIILTVMYGLADSKGLGLFPSMQEVLSGCPDDVKAILRQAHRMAMDPAFLEYPIEQMAAQAGHAKNARHAARWLLREARESARKDVTKG